MQYNCLYKQIAYFNRTINLTITKQTKKLKNKKIQYGTYASIDYVIYLDCCNFKLHLKSHFKPKTTFNFQIFKFFTGSLWNKGQSKMKRERNDENSCLLGFLRAQFLDSKAKT